MTNDRTVMVTITHREPTPSIHIAHIVKTVDPDAMILLAHHETAYDGTHLLITDTLPDHTTCDLVILYAHDSPSLDILEAAHYPVVWVRDSDCCTLLTLLNQIMDTSNGQIKKYKERHDSRS